MFHHNDGCTVGMASDREDSGMRCLFGALLLILLLVNSAWAGVLRLADVTWSLTAGSSSTFYVQILNEQGVTDRLASWQLELMITPVGGATGVLQFESADLPRQPLENYLLEGDSGRLAGLPSSPIIVGPTGTVLLSDYAFSMFGSEVPRSGKTLLRIDFSAPKDAEGVFAIAAVPGADGSFWASFDTNDSDSIMRGFGGIPIDSVIPVVIGHVTIIPIPEPHGLLLLLTVAITWWFGCQVGKR